MKIRGKPCFSSELCSEGSFSNGEATSRGQVIYFFKKNGPWFQLFNNRANSRAYLDVVFRKIFETFCEKADDLPLNLLLCKRHHVRPLETQLNEGSRFLKVLIRYWIFALCISSVNKELRFVFQLSNKGCKAYKNATANICNALFQAFCYRKQMHFPIGNKKKVL